MQRRHTKIIILNRSFPPHSSATGFHACDLALFLHNYFEVEVISLKGKKNKFDHYEINYKPLLRTYLPALYNGKQVFLRLISSFLESLLILIKATRKKGDHYIVMSDPPFLMWLSTFFIKTEKLSFWMMDIYPDVFVAAGLVKRQSSWIDIIRSRLIRMQPLLFFALGENQREYLKQRYFNRSNSLCWPVGLINSKSEKVEVPDWYEKDKIHLGYIGNIGTAHDTDIIFKTLQAIDAEKYRFIFSIDANSRNRIDMLDYNGKNVEFVEYIDSAQMKYIDVQIVTLKKAFTHLSVPSKAITSVQYGIPVIFFGDKNSDTWGYVKKVGWHLDCNSSLEEVSEFYSALNTKDINEKKKYTSEISKTYQQKKNEAYHLLKELIID